jgi:mycobactin polyketide synthetase MbtD
MDPDAAVRAGMRRHQGDPLLFAADFDRLRMYFESQGVPMPFTDTQDADPSVGNPEKRSLAEEVRTALAATLSLPDPGTVDLDVALTDLGIDSLLALDFRKRLRRSSSRSVSPARLLGGISGAELIDALQPSPSTALPRSEKGESARD